MFTNNKEVRETQAGDVSVKTTDLLENFWAEPLQAVDSVLRVVKDYVQSLAAGHHAESVVQTGQSDLPAARYQHVTGLHTPNTDRQTTGTRIHACIYINAYLICFCNCKSSQIL